MSHDYDVIVIGGGHNGLVTAVYLARAGKRVLLVEQRDDLGGVAIAGGDDAGLFRQTIADDLGLANHGLEWIEPEVTAFAPQPNGTALTLWRDIEQSVAEIGRFSAADAAKFPEFRAQVARLTAVLEPHLRQTPSLSQMGSLFVGQPELVRFASMAVNELLNNEFASEALKGLLGSSGIMGLMQGPYAQTTGFMLLYQYATAGSGGFRASRFVRGGMGQLIAALAGAARQAGVEIQTATAVDHILLIDGQAKGIVTADGATADGATITAGTVASSADPRHTFFGLVGAPNLEPRFVRRVRNIIYRGSTAKLNLTLSTLPTFIGQTEAQQLNGHILIAPGLDYLERAYDDAKYGRFSRHPYLDITIPTLRSPELTPAGQHLLSVTMQYAPYTLHDSRWETERVALAQTILETLNAYAPGLAQLVQHQQLLTPLDWEQQYGLTEGSTTHGEMGLGQMFMLRPVPGWGHYRTPIDNLYLCGAGTHPGGGVTGLPGHNAAQAIMNQL